jgi:hypothetical protein
VGIVDLGGGRYQVTIADDEEQEGDPNDCVETSAIWDGAEWDGALAGDTLYYFVVECPTVDPSPTKPTSWSRVKSMFR